MKRPGVNEVGQPGEWAEEVGENIDPPASCRAEDTVGSSGLPQGLRLCVRAHGPPGSDRRCPHCIAELYNREQL